MPSIPTYHSFVQKTVVAGFGGINRHDYSLMAKNFAPDVHHRFAGDHALGGERHDPAALLAWFERVGRVFPDLTLDVTDVTVKGGPHNTAVVVRWEEHARLADGSLYRNRGLHVIRLRWGKIVDMDVYLDTALATAALERQAAAGIGEATAAPIVS